ncbi:NUDIX hydrolase [Oscillatoriales cyanobacterium USR001]|nr:NUDIX hydrolase [Oscillatoriales cyanobacterium USR001]
MTNKKIEVAIAILYQDGKFLLQLRDDIPGIPYPGQWAFFGGHIEVGETPEVAIKRELEEEISYHPSIVTKFCCYEDLKVIRHVFYAELKVDIKDLVLKEGWDLGLLTPEEIRLGSCYSEKAGMVRSLGSPHQRILLDFMEAMERLALH